MKDLLAIFLEDLGFTFPEKQIEPEEEIKEKENVISEMNDMERDLYSLCCEGHDKLLISLEPTSANKISEKDKRLYYMMQIARKIMWASIQTRVKHSEGFTAMGIRKGFKIVEINREEQPDFGIIIPDLMGLSF